MKNIRKFTLIALIFVLSFIYSDIAFSLDSDTYGKGLIPYTEEQAKQFRRAHKGIRKVHLNKFGLKRINKEREKRRLRQLTEESALPIGQDIEASVQDDTILEGAGADNNDLMNQDEPLSEIPTYVDNSNTPYFPPIRSQGSLSCCVSFSITYTQFSYMVAFQKGLAINNSDNTNKYSPRWTYNLINDGQDGGSSVGENYNILSNHGAATWAEFPYDGVDYRSWCMEPSVWKNAIPVRANPAQYLMNVSNDAVFTQLKQLLTNGYILIFGTFINSWQYSKVKNNPATTEDDAFVGQNVAYFVNGMSGGHAMTIVGYNDNIWTDINNNGVVDPGEKGALLIANSWGTRWGNAGFMWLAYDALKSISAVSGGPSENRIKALVNDMVYHITIRESYTPSLVAEFTLNHAKRNQLRMTLGISEPSRTTPATTWNASAINYSGGSYAFDGTTTPCDGTFVFDFTDLLQSDNATKKYYLGMEDSSSGDTATLKTYKIIDLSTNPAREILSTDIPKTIDSGKVYSAVTYQYATNNILPVAVLSATPTSGYAPLEVLFSGASSYDPDGTIVAYNWDFGDSTTGTGKTITHTYTKSGTFTAKLSVTDDRNDVATDSTTINVNKVNYGDVSGDGEISAYDASLTAMQAVGLIDLTAEQKLRADVSGNGQISAYDASLIAQFAVGLINKFPVEN